MEPIADYYGVGGNTPCFFDTDWYELAVLLLVAPLSEELIFRGYLSGYTKHYLFILIQILLFVILHITWVVWVSVCSVLLIGLFFNETKEVGDDDQISKRLLYLSALFSSILFSLGHLMSMTGDSAQNKIIVALIAFLPGGLLFSYVRFKEGILAAIIVHALINLGVVSLNTLLSYF
ncbi:CPBP family intramembrane glutamic endopeptidase [Echinicola sediminis]